MTTPPWSRLDIARKSAVELPKIELNQLCGLRVDRVEDSDDRSRMRVASRWLKDNPSAAIAGSFAHAFEQIAREWIFTPVQMTNSLDPPVPRGYGPVN